MTLTFQEVITRLQNFWALEHGCVLWQPYNIQLGAGTGNPATLLRVLGPEPWRVVYVEPSVRPDDGRYGENPNRMQYYFQYQVILKPDPGNPQEIYLKSLEAIGINTREHDIRFVEDNWESPALGAWGLGWEVWMDGQEITQFTYFQQAGGINLEPVSVEITYGLERIVLALQGVNSVWDIEFRQGLSYGDVFLRSEIEHCTYYFEVADVEGLRQTFGVYEQEHHRALEHGLVIPAYDYVLKCSHLFNVLDTRGAIGVTERAQYFRRMRNMTLNIAKAYAKQREAMEHPFTKLLNTGWVAPYHPLEKQAIPAPTETADFLFEIGVEELPADDVDDALMQLQTLAPAFFEELRLSHVGLEIYATPRRLVIVARQLAIAQTDETEEVKGPPVSAAVDKDGNWTKAAEGFARKNDLTVGDLQRKQFDGGEYVVAMVEHKGRPVTEILAEKLPQLVASLKFNKTMRWNASGIAFSRPIRWFVALYGAQRIPFEYAQVKSGSTTRGVRPLSSPEIALTDVASYFTAMNEQGIILDFQKRREVIWQQAQQLASAVNGTIPEDTGLLDEVTNLVEQPTALRGAFDERFLKLPREVLVTVMKKHQRYFAVEDANGNMSPYFIAVRNGDSEHLAVVTHGNEHVLVARFTDAEFFYNSDVKQPLAAYLPRLSTLTFQEKLGSMLDKNNRVAGMVKDFGYMLNAADDLIEVAHVAAGLAKADLATQMVVEMTSLQGIIGRFYAELHGETSDVATAIYEHWLPRFAGDSLPASAAGVLLALLDRLDSLVGLFAVGLAPTGSADPFALRRAALGLLQILIDRDLDINLRGAVALVARAQPVEVTYEQENSVVDFIVGRFKAMLLEQNEPFDVVEAVLAEQAANPVRAVQSIRELKTWTQRENWEKVLDAYARCVRIIRSLNEVYPLHAEALTEPAEIALYRAYNHLIHTLGVDYTIGDFLTVFEPFVPTINAFFDNIMVMDEDMLVRQNRLALLQSLTALTKGRADLSHLSGF